MLTLKETQPKRQLVRAESEREAFCAELQRPQPEPCVIQSEQELVSKSNRCQSRLIILSEKNLRNPTILILSVLNSVNKSWRY